MKKLEAAIGSQVKNKMTLQHKVVR